MDTGQNKLNYHFNIRIYPSIIHEYVIVRSALKSGKETEDTKETLVTISQK